MVGMSKKLANKWRALRDREVRNWRATWPQFVDGPDLSCPDCGGYFPSRCEVTVWETETGKPLEWGAPVAECKACGNELIQPYDITYCYPLEM